MKIILIGSSERIRRIICDYAYRIKRGQMQLDVIPENIKDFGDMNLKALGIIVKADAYIGKLGLPEQPTKEEILEAIAGFNVEYVENQLLAIEESKNNSVDLETALNTIDSLNTKISNLNSDLDESDNARVGKDKEIKDKDKLIDKSKTENDTVIKAKDKVIEKLEKEIAKLKAKTV